MFEVNSALLILIKNKDESEIFSSDNTSKMDVAPWCNRWTYGTVWDRAKKPHKFIRGWVCALDARRGEDDLVGLIVLAILVHKGYIKRVCCYTIDLVYKDKTN